MTKYTDEFLEAKLKEYWVEVKPESFSWGNDEDVNKLIQWIESKGDSGRLKEKVK